MIPSRTTLSTLLTILAATTCCAGCAVDEYSTPMPQQAPQGTQEHQVRRLDSVHVNGQPLTQARAQLLETHYGGLPTAGSYWYDPMSGLYGGAGQPAAGYMAAGHDFGPLPENASSGQAPLWFNGRQLTWIEVQGISALLGMPATAGRYWFDAQGNVGLENTSQPLVNLYAAAQAKASRGATRGGDNFWRSYTGTGNSNAGNTEGYISFSDGSSVTYGF